MIHSRHHHEAAAMFWSAVLYVGVIGVGVFVLLDRMWS